MKTILAICIGVNIALILINLHTLKELQPVETTTLKTYSYAGRLEEKTLPLPNPIELKPLYTQFRVQKRYDKDGGVFYYYCQGAPTKSSTWADIGRGFDILNEQFYAFVTYEDALDFCKIQEGKVRPPADETVWTSNK